MALNTTTPADLTTTNSLASIAADLLGPIPAEIRLGSTVLMMLDSPPEVGDVLTVTMRLKVKRKAEDEAGECGDERVHFRACKVVAAWLKGEPEPQDDADDDVPMINTDGSIADTDEVDNVVRPPFSDTSK